MRLSLRHPLPAPVERAWEQLQTPDYAAALSEVAAVDREVLQTGSAGGLPSRTVRLTGRKPLPGAVAKLLGSSQIRYVQEERIDAAARTIHWRVTAPDLSDRFEAQGTWRIIAEGTSSVRLIEGEIRVSIPLVGGKIERAVVEELTASYDKSAAFAQRWLTERP